MGTDLPGRHLLRRDGGNRCAGSGQRPLCPLHLLLRQHNSGLRSGHVRIEGAQRRPTRAPTTRGELAHPVREGAAVALRAALPAGLHPEAAQAGLVRAIPRAWGRRLRHRVGGGGHRLPTRASCNELVQKHTAGAIPAALPTGCMPVAAHTDRGVARAATTRSRRSGRRLPTTGDRRRQRRRRKRRLLLCIRRRRIPRCRIKRAQRRINGSSG